MFFYRWGQQTDMTVNTILLEKLAKKMLQPDWPNSDNTSFQKIFSQPEQHTAECAECDPPMKQGSIPYLIGVFDAVFFLSKRWIFFWMNDKDSFLIKWNFDLNTGPFKNMNIFFEFFLSWILDWLLISLWSRTKPISILKFKQEWQFCLCVKFSLLKRVFESTDI